MEHRIEVIWTCAPCEVGGQDARERGSADPLCWNCGGPVVVVGRPAALRIAAGPDAA
ncbi:hypothetical protein JD79_03034 [Geodermatophilus normandii]|uniref:Uncharacterized protein n=1 Tax=Geodermatophilus normandii TaxID=1137989 RepID=A0A317QJH7_9ACTN|nr:hypothetical protein [Geodermatophilus normandii]PWW23858.1 hypothetical protein JD79_03034 [Geodermatophilus normandii]